MNTVVILSEQADIQDTELKNRLCSSGHHCTRFEIPRDIKDEKLLDQLLPSETPDCYLISTPSPSDKITSLLGFLRLYHPHAAIMLVADKLDNWRDEHFPVPLIDGSINRDSTKEQFLSSFRRIIRNHRTGKELWYLRRRDAQGSDIGGIVANCQSMKEVVRKVITLCRRTIRQRPPAVLITGETGTGKGQIARAIHYNGTRRDMTLAEVNCAALPKELIEAELFGCEKGAFTGADTSRPGLMEVAHKGSVFLDEVSSLSPEHQTKLLRFLDERRVRRVGSTTERQLDIQVITATNRNLEEAVYEGEFREDLFFRLNVIQIHLPPLRERGHDIVELAANYLNEFCKSYGVPKKTFTPETEEAILNYNWPGNIRELRNRIERVVLLSEHRTVVPELLELPGHHDAAIDAMGERIEVRLPPDGIKLEDVERAVIDKALMMTGDNTSKAARLLGLGRSALRYRNRRKKNKG